MKKIYVILNIIFVIIIAILLLQILDKNEYINEIKSEYSIYQEEKDNETDEQIENNKVLKNELEQLREMVQNLEIINEELHNEIENLTIIDYISIEDLKRQGIEDYNIIIDDLYTRPELIPFDGILGGTMSFKKIYVLNDEWVYAMFDDGHINGYALYEYSIDDNLNISWKVIDAMLYE